jgi:hypothetical protein
MSLGCASWPTAQTLPVAIDGRGVTLSLLASPDIPWGIALECRCWDL